MCVTDMAEKSEGLIKVHKSKITELECKNEELTSRCEKYSDEIRNLKIQLASVKKLNSKHEENIQFYESKIAELEVEKREFTSKIRCHSEEVNKLKLQIANFEEYKLRNEEKQQTEKNANNLLHRDLELFNGLVWTEHLPPGERTVREMKSIFVELQEDCKKIVSGFVEQQKKFEEMSEKLHHAEASLEKVGKDGRELKHTSSKPENKVLQSISIPQELSKTALKTEPQTESPQELQISKKPQRNKKLEKLNSGPKKAESVKATTQKEIVYRGKEEMDKESSPLKPRNKKLPKAEKLEPEKTKLGSSNTTPAQKNAKRKNVQDENVCSPFKEKNLVLQNGSSFEQDRVSVPSRGRNLRSRKKAE